MTLIEFFDEEKLDNVVGTLILHPERTVFLCPGKRDEAFLKALRKILEARGVQTEIVMECVDVTDLQRARACVEEIVNKYPDADFDIAGGNDVMLVVMGEIAKKYNLPMHIASVKSKNVTSINSGKMYKTYDTFLSVEELISVYGGKVAKDGANEATYTWTRNLAEEEEIEKVWNVCKSDTGAWNSAIGAMRGTGSVDKRNVLAMTWSKLKKEGLVRREGNQMRYKSNLVRFLLQKQGTALEMYTYITAKKTEFFDDGQCSVIIDWKGHREVENEIDVLLTRGMTGYFVSCKNGLVDSDELYKLSIVAERFGGKYAKKILVLSRFEPDMSFMNRAEELGIRVVKNVRVLKDKDFGKRLIN